MPIVLDKIDFASHRYGVLIGDLGHSAGDSVIRAEVALIPAEQSLSSSER